jgi:hypothetical protein
VLFLLKYHQNPPSPQETEHKKREREKLLKRKEKREEKGKLQEFSNKKEVNILIGEKHFNFKNILFDVIPFSPPPSYHFKNPFQNH